MNPVFDLSERVALIPVVHGSAFFAHEVRRRLRARPVWDCLAGPLPPGFAAGVEAGVARLPRVSAVIQEEIDPVAVSGPCSYVPVDPCQPVVVAVREAVAAGVPRAWVDLEVDRWEPGEGQVLPDAWALPRTGLEAFAAACLPVLRPPPPDSQRAARIRHTAARLRHLEAEHEAVVHVCSLADWPWLRQAWQGQERAPDPAPAVSMPILVPLTEDSLTFVLGELPWLTYLYEHRLAEAVAGGDAVTHTVDGVKALLLEARDRARHTAEPEGTSAGAAAWLTPQRLRLLLQYVRNLTLIDGRMTPQLYDLALAARQVIGDDYALALIETARRYPPQRIGPRSAGEVRLLGDRLADCEAGDRPAKNRLQGVPKIWRKLVLRPTPPAPLRQHWRLEWDPFGQCSWPPEDTRIENFQQHMRDQARALLGLDLPRVEKFTASLKDGLDLRETLRNWYTGDLYVKELPPSRGGVEIVVMLFDVPADPERYAWRSTWYAEHAEESTLSFFATPFQDHLVGPGIGEAVYGGCLFLYPPRPIPDLWTDPRLRDFVRLEERLLAGACLHSRERRVVVVAPKAPPPAWRRMARQLRRRLVYLPLRRFSADTVARLRRFHVLNGRHVRSYAAGYIRPPR